MYFILQSDIDSMDIEHYIIKDVILNRSHHTHKYEPMRLVDITKDKADGKPHYACAIPVGSIPFVEEWARVHHGVHQINPVEIPKELQIPEYLLRDYKFIDSSEIPKAGSYFIKHVDRLKSFSFSGELANLEHYELKPGIYLISNEVKIKAEYRVYVINREIHSITQYDGSPIIQPDVKKISNITLKYIYWYDVNSFSFDVAVLANGETMLLEIHPFASIGLYNSLWGQELATAYCDGFEYITKQNYKKSFL